MKARYLLTGVLACLVLLAGCEAPSNPEFGSGNPDPNPPGTAAASITQINPTSALPGATVTITGTGFSAIPSQNLVSFGPNVAEVMTASATQLEVAVPFASGNIMIKVAVPGAVLWSNEVAFEFESFIPEIDPSEALVIDDEIVWQNGVAVDDADNVYIGSNNDAIIYKITPAGDKSEFVSIPVVGTIHFGPSGYLYVCEKWEGKVQRVSPDGMTVEDVVDVADVVDFDWDENGNMWLISGDYGVFVMPSGGGAATEVVGDIGSVKNGRVYDGYLYVSKIWDQVLTRFEISGTSLGEEETYLEIDDSGPSSFDFDLNGTLYYAYAWNTTLYMYAPGGAEEATAYDDELMTPMRYMKYHNDKIYIVFPGWADVGQTMRIHIGLNQAPRYGRQ